MAATESMHITRFNPMSAGSFMRKHATNVLNERDMHQGLQEDQECQNRRNRFECFSPRPLPAALSLFRVSKATALP
eukprot:5820652-Prorocentrum_lima.AAC.1